jgi:hypothetical protein
MMENRWEKSLIVSCPECGRGIGANCKSLAKRPQNGTGGSNPVGSDREMPHHSRIHLSKSKTTELEMEFDAWFADIKADAWNRFISLFKHELSKRVVTPYERKQNDKL